MVKRKMTNLRRLLLPLLWPIVAVMALLFTATSAMAETNIITNGDFESDTAVGLWLLTKVLEEFRQ